MSNPIWDYLLIKWSGEFDPAYYLLEYPDCRHADVDPLWHFVMHGWREGRNPSPRFQTAYYLKTYPDVAQARMNPLVHYIRFGMYEGRSPSPPQIGTASDRSRTHVDRKTGNRPSWLSNVVWLVGTKMYWTIPARYRLSLLNWTYQNLGFLFRGTPDYESWLARQRHLAPLNLDYHSPDLLDLDTISPAKSANGRIAIHAHVFYPDLAPELAHYLRNMPFPYHLYVSVTTQSASHACQEAFQDLPQCEHLDIRLVPNRGRDLGPFFGVFGNKLATYDYVAHVHTKKSEYNKGATYGWREYLYRALFGDSDRIRRIFTLLNQESPYGIVYPQNYTLLPPWANTWLANKALAQVWCAKIGLTKIPDNYLHYPAGSMFWARSEALAPLFEAGITLDDFPEESGQTDGTLAHTLERLLVLSAHKQGFRHAILRDEEHPSWSPWRFDQYFARTPEMLRATVNAPDIKVIGFDIFDTLVTRPLLHPEHVKKIVARRVGGKAQQAYEAYRYAAEQHARQIYKRDVDLEHIFDTLGTLADLENSELETLKNTEVEVEKALIRPRNDVVRLFQDALTTGKPVVLISDMFLPRHHVEAILQSHGVSGWTELYLSNEINARKDNGTAYHRVLDNFKVKPQQFLMVGDNERSDIQIPTDLGAKTLHIPKPVDFAKALPRLARVVALHEQRDDLDAEITLGLVLSRIFSPLVYPEFDPASLVPVTPFNIGYTLVGPILTSFAAWLVQKADEDGINILYFLSREGRLMKEIYDCWTENLENAPRSKYLVISRRTASVAAITSFKDILRIAETIYFENTIENFLYTRYGLRFTDKKWDELFERTGWHRERLIAINQRKLPSSLVDLLDTIKEDIFERARLERHGLLAYLDEQGLTQPDSCAVVDIGYGGTIQYHLNNFLQKPIHGYYMMTDEGAQRVLNAHQVILRGCFCENVTRTPHAPAIYRWNFEVEKLMSTTEPQVEYYRVDASGNVQGHFRPLTPEEEQPAPIREQIRKGALMFAQDARAIRTEVLLDYRPSCETAQMLLESFLDERSPTEDEFLSKITLDDFYCGRGLIS